MVSIISLFSCLLVRAFHADPSVLVVYACINYLGHLHNSKQPPLVYTINITHVSIHTPARGATYGIGNYQPSVEVSIHTPARGATENQVLSPDKMRFQSTPPHGGRLRNRTSLSRPRSFNPHPRTGGDSLSRPRKTLSPVSIHTPARGATL